MLRLACFMMAAGLFFTACQGKEDSKPLPEGDTEMAVQITSTAFAEGEMIPKQYTCDGADISPPLTWTGVPASAKSLALIADDPDAPMGTWVHWVLYNIAPDTSGLPEKVPPDDTVLGGATHGKTDFGRLGYGGPCPPGGTHRYFFKLYALDMMLDLPVGATKEELLKAMKGHVLAEGELMGKYKRQR